jgi:hypothetical protein
MALVESLVTLPGFVLYLSVILTYVNSATNPWIYGIWNKGFRDYAVLACQKRVFRKKTIHPSRLSFHVELRRSHFKPATQPG